MANLNPIKNRDARYCRDCGGPLTTLFESYKICENTTTKGTQQDPKDICESLSRDHRVFCEYCGCRVGKGATVCPKCGRVASRP